MDLLKQKLLALKKKNNTNSDNTNSNIANNTNSNIANNNTNSNTANNKIKSISVKYTDDFIKETYGDDDVVYMESNIQKIVIGNGNGNRPFFWMFQNRKDFPNWVTETFMKYNSCDKSKNIKNSNKFEYSPAQKFIRDYLGHASPYRGLLLYHGLGTGKTCASIAVSENLKDNRNVVIFLPASLEGNFKKRIKKNAVTLCTKLVMVIN